MYLWAARGDFDIDGLNDWDGHAMALEPNANDGVRLCRRISGYPFGGGLLNGFHGVDLRIKHGV